MGRRKSTKSPSKESEELEIAGDESPIALVQMTLRQRLSQFSSPLSITGLEKEKKQLYDLIHRTSTTGESNSVLVIGPRGAGKSMLLKTVLSELGAEKDFKQNLLQVHLNGLLQTDDRIALKEITRQLQLENTVGDRVFGSFSENLQFLLDALKSGGQKSKPVLFILDEFDLFAHHRNQTLLYNLFDISQSAQTPVCVIGVTCRLDVIELLEKRVKSRFSHRQIHVFNALSYKDYCTVCRNLLSLSDQFPDKTFAKTWNHHIKELLQDSVVEEVLFRQYNLNKDVRGLKTLLVQPICQLSPVNPILTTSAIVDAFKLIATDSKAAMLHGISILELCLIIAMKHLSDIYEGEPFNFEMVYSEYMKFAKRKSGMQIFEKPVVLKAFEHLMALELIKTIDNGGTRIQKEYRLMSLLIHPTQITDALQKYPNCPTEVKQWATSALA
ncbi:origin recognition complex subunit 4 [Patella vulgata]|uniref:origin recognition complex subunit 4 n=1 Tax=Patella vulgata TaxID=6465 RepID=UPI00217FC775|nr:origin recognition complex subunit 4 [Patella vulgata]